MIAQRRSRYCYCLFQPRNDERATVPRDVTSRQEKRRRQGESENDVRGRGMQQLANPIVVHSVRRVQTASKLNW